jgi:exosortase/archaeosortase family protein
MRRFIALYFLFLGALFVVFYASSWQLTFALNNIQTNFTLQALSLFLKPEQLQGIDIWINPHYKIIITKACNGIIPILFLYASILAYPSTFGHKILWMVLGYILFFVVNIVRILWVVFVTQSGEGQGDFYWSHDIVGNTLLMLTGLGLFIAFIQTSSKNKVDKNVKNS